MKAKTQAAPQWVGLADLTKGDPTSIECPTCDAWVGWCCKGRAFGYHAAGYHAARRAAADALRLFDVTAAGIELFGDAFALGAATADQLAEISMLLEDTEGVA